MLKPIPFANAMAVVWIAAYIICVAFAVLLPNVYLGLAGSWIHAINLAMSNKPVFSLPSFAFGLITFSMFMWVISFAFAKLYNIFSKQ